MSTFAVTKRSTYAFESRFESTSGLHSPSPVTGNEEEEEIREASSIPPPDADADCDADTPRVWLDELERESHKLKFEEEKQKELKRQGSVEDGEVEGGGADKDLLPSQKMENELKQKTEKLDALKETKKEMVWLLKQVIKAETKRKASESILLKKKQKL